MKLFGLLLPVICLLASCSVKTHKQTISGGVVGNKPEPLVVDEKGQLTEDGIGIAAKAPIRASIDPDDREVLHQRAPETLQKLDNREPLNIQDVKNMVKNGLRDEIILYQIHATKSSFSLSDEEVNDLRESGVSEKVINAMMLTCKKPKDL